MKAVFQAFSFHVKPEEDSNADTYSCQIFAVAPLLEISRGQPKYTFYSKAVFKTFEAFSFHVKSEEDANTFSRQIFAVAPFKVILEVETTSVFQFKFVLFRDFFRYLGPGRNR